MFVKTQQLGGSKRFFLCIGERGGNSANGTKSVEYSVGLGETLDLSAEQWRQILGRAANFRSVPLQDVLKTLEKYASTHGIGGEALAGLREAANVQKQSPRGLSGDRRSGQDQRSTALRMLGLEPGASDHDIELAFRKRARRYHPDVGGDAAKFRAILNARNLLLARETSASQRVPGRGET